MKFFMAWFSRIGLQKKTFIYVGAGLTTLTVLLILLSLQTINQSIDMVYRQRMTIAQNIALSIDEVIQHLRTEVVDAAIVLEDGWQEGITDFEKEQLTLLKYRLERHLKSFHQIEQTVFVALLDDRGKVLWIEPYLAQEVSRSLADIPAVREVFQSGQVYLEVKEALLSVDSPTLSLVAPIKDDQNVVRGVLIADMPALPGSGGFSVYLQRWQAGFDLELVTENGIVLGSSTPGETSKRSFHWSVIRVLAKERLSGVIKHPKNREMEDHIVAFAPLSMAPWSVILEQPEEQILALPQAMGRRLLLVSGVAVLVAAGLIWGFTRQIISPLRRLAATAQRFGAGDLEASIPPMGQDEIGQLAQSFDTMRHQLKHSLDEISQWNQELEQRVKQRTTELEGLYQELNQRDKERGDLLRKIITAQEEERLRIARELHDEVSQTLTGLVMSLGSTEALLDHDPTAARQRLESLRVMSSEAVEEVRRLIRNLRPSLLDDLGLVAAIDWYAENYLAPAGVKAELETKGFGQRLPSPVEITLFRVVQEAITNIVKHAQAKTAHIRLQLTPSAIVGSIKDDGVGFGVDNLRRQRRKGIAVGLLGMEERINLLGGKLNIKSQPGEGTQVYFKIPWEESNDGENSGSDS